MNIVYIIIDLFIVIGAVFAAYKVKNKRENKKKQGFSARSTERFKNKKLYEEEMLTHLDISDYHPALNDPSISYVEQKEYRYKSNPRFEHEHSNAESERMMRRTERLMMHQAIINNENNINGF